MEDLRIRFGNLVAAHRKRCGMTQDALSLKTGLSVEMISRLETGASGARFGTIEKLATAFEIDPAQLFTPHIPASALERPKLTAIMSRIARLSDSDLDWLEDVLKPILKHR